MTFESYRPEFDESTHRYWLADQPDLKLTPVTQVVKMFVHEFDADAVAAKCAFERKVKKADLLNEWIAESVRASVAGTLVHEAAEKAVRSINDYGGFTRTKCQSEACRPFVDAAYDYLATNIDMAFGWVEAELRVCHPEFGIAGTIDLAHGVHNFAALKDWKTSKKVDLFGYGSKNMYSPLNRFPDSNYWHYACQMNLYRFILKDVHGVEADTLDLVWLLPSGNWQEIYVPIFKDALIIKTLEKFRKKMEKKQ